MIYLYRSQWDADANQRRNDCGPACVAMVLQAFGQYVDINELSLIDAGDDGTTAAELIALLARRGIEARQTATPSAPRHLPGQICRLQARRCSGYELYRLALADPAGRR